MKKPKIILSIIVVLVNFAAGISLNNFSSSAYEKAVALSFQAGQKNLANFVIENYPMRDDAVIYNLDQFYQLDQESLFCLETEEKISVSLDGSFIDAPLVFPMAFDYINTWSKTVTLFNGDYPYYGNSVVVSKKFCDDRNVSYDEIVNKTIIDSNGYNYVITGVVESFNIEGFNNDVSFITARYRNIMQSLKLVGMSKIYANYHSSRTSISSLFHVFQEMGFGIQQIVPPSIRNMVRGLNNTEFALSIFLVALFLAIEVIIAFCFACNKIRFTYLAVNSFSILIFMLLPKYVSGLLPLGVLCFVPNLFTVIFYSYAIIVSIIGCANFIQKNLSATSKKTETKK